MSASKRPLTDPNSDPTQQYRSVRRKVSPAAPHNASGSDTSSSSETSAVLSALGNVHRKVTPDTEYSESGDESSEISSSSEEPSSESEDDEDEEDEDGINENGSLRAEGDEPEAPITVVGRPRPTMRLRQDERERGATLRERLKSFMPQIAAANKELDEERAAGTLSKRNIENVDENTQEQYIEMNLGLGVLEENNPNTCEPESDSESVKSGEVGEGNAKERDILGKLMGQKREGSGIEVLDG